MGVKVMRSEGLG